MPWAPLGATFGPMWRVLVSDDMRLGEVRYPGVILDYRPGIGREELLEIIPAYDALITRSRTRVDAELLQRGKRLKVVGRGGVGVDNVDPRRQAASGSWW